MMQGITDEQAALQMGAWAIFAAPLIMGNDVRNLTALQRIILLNKAVIAINQDPLGTIWDLDTVQHLKRALQVHGHHSLVKYSSCMKCAACTSL